MNAGISPPHHLSVNCLVLFLNCSVLLLLSLSGGVLI